MGITLDNLDKSLKKQAVTFEFVGLVSESRVVGIMPFAGEIKDVRVYADSTSGNPQFSIKAGSTSLCTSTSVVADTATDCPVISGAEASKNDLLTVVNVGSNAAFDDLIVKLVFERTEDLEDIS